MFFDPPQVYMKEIPSFVLCGSQWRFDSVFISRDSTFCISCSIIAAVPQIKQMTVNRIKISKQSCFVTWQTPSCNISNSTPDGFLVWVFLFVIVEKSLNIKRIIIELEVPSQHPLERVRGWTFVNVSQRLNTNVNELYNIDNLILKTRSTRYQPHMDLSHKMSQHLQTTSGCPSNRAMMTEELKASWRPSADRHIRTTDTVCAVRAQGRSTNTTLHSYIIWPEPTLDWASRIKQSWRKIPSCTLRKQESTWKMWCQ